MSIINSVIKGKQPVIDTLNVTPTTSAQQITAPSGTDGYSPVNVSAVTSSIDANIVAGNIKDGVSILGVTGSYTGTTPTGTKSITSNGVYDVTNFASADVQVPTTAPAHYIEKTKDANGKLQNSTNIIDLNGVTDIGDYVLTCGYYQSSFPANTSIDLSSLTTLSGSHACQQMFYNCTSITSVDLSGLITVSGLYSCQQMFYNCTSITSVDLSGLTTVSGQYSCHQMFSGCTGLISVDISSLTTISDSNGCNSMFSNCTSLTSINLSGLTTISGSSACQSMFANCTSLATVYIGGTTAINFGSRTSQFNSMFFGCTQNIDVYAPAASQSAIEAFSGYPNFGATGTVTWHWNS